MSRNLRVLTLLDPSGPAWPVMGVLYLYLYLLYLLNIYHGFFQKEVKGGWEILLMSLHVYSIYIKYGVMYCCAP
jgi:hypothetical protein